MDDPAIGAPHPGKTSTEVLVEHAHRLWVCECENAERISKKSQLFAGAVLAMLGLGLFNLSWRYGWSTSPIFPAWLAWILHALLFAAICCFAWSLALMYGLKPAKHGTSTELMELTDEDIGKPIRGLIFNKVYSAYFDLKDRNRFHWNKLKKAQKWFSSGVALVFLVVVTYHWGSIGARTDQGGHHEHGNTKNTSSEDIGQRQGVGAPSGGDNQKEPQGSPESAQ